MLSVDEKTQVQALDRTQPMLPLRPGQVERHTHDYKRHGVLSLFAALDVATGHVTNETRARHTGDDFLAFLRRIAREYSGGEVHVILDNVSTHKTPAVQAWLARHRRFTFHFTPTSASWMNQVETWFSILTRQALRRGSFESLRALSAAVERFTRKWNTGASPFHWVKTADEILAKAVRKTQADSGAGLGSAQATLRTTQRLRARPRATWPQKSSGGLTLKGLPGEPLLSGENKWRARQDSNLRPSAPEADALSTELQAREPRS